MSKTKTDILLSIESMDKFFLDFFGTGEFYRVDDLKKYNDKDLFVRLSDLKKILNNLP